MVSCQYLAGLFDGEGHIGITISPSASGKGKGYRFGIRPMTRVEVGLLEADSAILDEIQEIYGGTIRKTRSVSQRGIVSHKRRWRLWDKKGMAQFLSELLPFLRIKKHEAELALKALALMVPPYTEALMRQLIDLSFAISEAKSSANEARRWYSKSELLSILVSRSKSQSSLS